MFWTPAGYNPNAYPNPSEKERRPEPPSPIQHWQPPGPGALGSSVPVFLAALGARAKIQNIVTPRIQAGIGAKPPLSLGNDNQDHTPGLPRGGGAKK